MDKMPRSSKRSEDLLRSLVPEGEGVTLRPMFGNMSAFVSGNMFMGVFGDDFLVRLPESDRAELLRAEGSAIFEPMKGRQMKEYVVVPRPWTRDPEKIRPWVARSLDWASRLPAKKKKR